jgi:hypothetical protein
MSRILIDACCGPCSLAAMDNFPRTYRTRRFLFYNPNIQPFREYRRRLESFEALMRQEGEEYTLLPYEPEEWIRAVAYREENRCEICYRLRLRKAADLAMEESFQAMTTTLFASPYQDHELLARLGDSVCRSRGLEFAVWDGRERYREILKLARERDMYTQPYCGCILSERERYDKRAGAQRKGKHATCE